MHRARHTFTHNKQQQHNWINPAHLPVFEAAQAVCLRQELHADGAALG
jgi:hypothetical protein